MVLRPMVLCVVLAAGATRGVTAFAAPGDAVAEHPPVERPRAAPEIMSTGSCPSADAIWIAMSSLVPSGALESLPRTAAVDVADAGDTYRVRLTVSNTQRVRVYRDVARDCEQRARFAAVFVVLTLMPPELLIETAPKLPLVEPIPELPPEPPAIVIEAPQRRLRFELTALGDTAPAVLSAPEMTSPGGELRVAIGGGRLAALFAIGVQPRTDFAIGALRAREQRIPIDAGVRWRQVQRWVEIDGEASLVAAIFRTQGLSQVVAKEATRVDLGARAGVVLRIGTRDMRIAPVAGVHAVYFPRPYDLAIMPAGVVGRTPSLRLGATAGLAASF